MFMAQLPKKAGLRRASHAVYVPTYNVHQAKTHLSKLLTRVMLGEEVVIAKAGKPVAKLVRITSQPKGRKLGIYKGKLKTSDGFLAPMSEEELALWYEGEIFPK